MLNEENILHLKRLEDLNEEKEKEKKIYKEQLEKEKQRHYTKFKKGKISSISESIRNFFINRR